MILVYHRSPFTRPAILAKAIKSIQESIAWPEGRRDRRWPKKVDYLLVEPRYRELISPIVSIRAYICFDVPLDISQYQSNRYPITIKMKMAPIDWDMAHPSNNPQFQHFPSRRSTVLSTKGMVASSQTLASAAGLEILNKGGNAGA